MIDDEQLKFRYESGDKLIEVYRDNSILEFQGEGFTKFDPKPGYVVHR